MSNLLNLHLGSFLKPSVLSFFIIFLVRRYLIIIYELTKAKEVHDVDDDDDAEAPMQKKRIRNYQNLHKRHSVYL